MTYTLYDATLDLARLLGPVRDGAATSVGTTTTVIDTQIAEPNDWYNDGTIWVAAHSAYLSQEDPAPTDEVDKARVISDYASATHTLTFAALTVPPPSGTNYSATNKKFPLFLLKQAVRQAVREIGPVALEKTFESDGSQTYYAYTWNGSAYVAGAAAEIDERIARIEISSQADEPRDWKLHRGWMVEPYRTNGHKQLVFFPGKEPASGQTIRLIYLAEHAAPVNDDDVIDAQIHPDYLMWVASVYAWRWRLGMVREDEPEAPERLKEAQAMAAQMAYKHRISRTALSSFGRW